MEGEAGCCCCFVCGAKSRKSTFQSGVQAFQADAFQHVQRVDHIAQGFAHFSAVRVPDHAVQVHVAERHLLCSFPSSLSANGLQMGKQSIQHRRWHVLL